MPLFIRLFLLSLALNLVMQPCQAGEIEDRVMLSEDVENAFLMQDFLRLEQLSNDFRTNKSRTRSGIWKLSVFYTGLQRVIDGFPLGTGQEENLAKLEKMNGRWIRKYPHSPSAHIMRSMILRSHAWSIRGNGYAAEVKKENWAPHIAMIRRVKGILDTNKSFVAVDPEWYRLMVQVARDQSWPRAEFDALVDEAVKREPYYYETYFAVFFKLLPMWGGGLDQMEEFAQKAQQWTAPQDGHGMYARLYWNASQVRFHNTLFTDSLAGWIPMSDAFDDLLARYPEPWNLNNYARFACVAGDKGRTRQLLQRIGSAVVSDAWSPADLFRQCADWAGTVDANAAHPTGIGEKIPATTTIDEPAEQ